MRVLITGHYPGKIETCHERLFEQEPLLRLIPFVWILVVMALWEMRALQSVKTISVGSMTPCSGRTQSGCSENFQGLVLPFPPSAA